MALKVFNLTGLIIEPLNDLHADLLRDYLGTTTYKWHWSGKPNGHLIEDDFDEDKQYFLIEDFEFTIEDLKGKINTELGIKDIYAFIYENTNF